MNQDLLSKGLEINDLHSRLRERMPSSSAEVWLTSGMNPKTPGSRPGVAELRQICT
jgi:hypothetical protein